MRKKLLYLTVLLLCGYSTVYAQNPIFIWGPGLDGSDFQKTGIFSDATNGLFFEAPQAPSGLKLPIVFSWRGGGLSALRILPNGNIGIGNENPQAKLDVTGDINSYYVGFGQNDYNTSSKNFVNFSSNNHGSVLISSNLYFKGDDTFLIAKSHPSMAGASILIPGNSRANQGGILFYTNRPAIAVADANFTGKLAMLIKNDGNVGIGTEEPGDYRLAVNGKIRAKEIRVDTEWSDFVFNDTYPLRTLSDVELYIKKKQTSTRYSIRKRS
ncbi:hypothetical protein [Pedobacter lusitanus]|uniref:hypothetical protein n=1 Tax=Pedobacter lusitanus TaxID=1503925 RepID=UPI00069685EA|nr:hypothetical protein [Pedobacter lusitanus]